jgi:3-dehydroquinate dehydratase / shikimate dehydrogenase
MAKICLCLTAPTLARDLELIEKYRDYIDMAELRVDFLDPDEQLLVRRFPEIAGVPIVLTIRRTVDGGRFDDGEGARLVLFGKALAFAEAERHKNFAYVDLEDDFRVASLEESARTFGTVIIRSFHDFTGVPADLADRLRRLPHNGDEIAKAAVMARGLDDVTAVFRAAQGLHSQRKILIAMGDFGTSTRILADRIGSYFTYSTPTADDMPLAGPGQADPIALSLMYRSGEIGPKSKIFGIVGYPLADTSTIGIHNSAFIRAGLDAACIPFKADSLEAFFTLADELKVRAVSIENPFLESVIPFLSDAGPMVSEIGACNTIVRENGGWSGYNTGCTGFRTAIIRFMGTSNLRGKKASVIGAGGMARTVVAVLTSLGAEVCILNRTQVRAKRLADAYGGCWAGLDGNGLERLSEFDDLIVQAGTAGAAPNKDIDPLDFYDFSGDEAVFDVVYKPARSRLLLRAEKAGCRTMNGELMFLEQSKAQFKLFTGLDFPV